MARNHAKPVDAAERRVKAVELRKTGMSYRAIAEAVGVNVATAHKYVSEAMKELAELQKDAAEDLRQMEHERLSDALERITNSDAYKAGEPQSVETARRLSESLRKLYGLDKPVMLENGQAAGGFTIHIHSAGGDDSDD